MEEEDVLPQMEVSGGKQGRLVDERLRALLMLLNQVRMFTSSICFILIPYFNLFTVNVRIVVNCFITI